MCSASGFSNSKVGCPHVRFTSCLYWIAVGLLRTENSVASWLPGPQSQGPRTGALHFFVFSNKTLYEFRLIFCCIEEAS